MVAVAEVDYHLCAIKTGNAANGQLVLMDSKQEIANLYKYCNMLKIHHAQRNLVNPLNPKAVLVLLLVLQ